MPLNRAFQRRLEIIDNCLRRFQRKWTAETILDEVNAQLEEKGYEPISIRTIYLDLKYLQEELNAPVEKLRQGKLVYYRYSERSYTVFQSGLSYQEKRLLQQLLAELKQQGSPYSSQLEELLSRHAAEELGRCAEESPKYINKEINETLFDEHKGVMFKMSLHTRMESVAYNDSFNEETNLYRLALRFNDQDWSSIGKLFWEWYDEKNKDEE